MKFIVIPGKIVSKIFSGLDKEEVLNQADAEDFFPGHDLAMDFKIKKMKKTDKKEGEEEGKDDKWELSYKKLGYLYDFSSDIRCCANCWKSRTNESKMCDLCTDEKICNRCMHNYSIRYKKGIIRFWRKRVISVLPRKICYIAVDKAEGNVYELIPVDEIVKRTRSRKKSKDDMINKILESDDIPEKKEESKPELPEAIITNDINENGDDEDSGQSLCDDIPESDAEEQVMISKNLQDILNNLQVKDKE